jgi:hypothetical protein
MHEPKRTRPTGASLAIYAAIFLFFTPFFIPRSILPFGFSFFFCWTALCVASVLANRLLPWAFLSCSALLMVSFDWWAKKGPPATDGFGFGAIDAIALFIGTALVVAATGILLVVRTAMLAHRNGS